MEKTGSAYGQRRFADTAVAGPPAGASAPVYAEQVRMLYDGATTAVLVNLANASILTALLWKVGDHSLLAQWLAAMVLLQLGRLALARFRRSFSARPERVAVVRIRSPIRWDRWYLAGVAASGLMWGLAGTVLFPRGAPGHQLILVFIIGGTVAGATAMLAPVWEAFPLFALPALVPFAATFLMSGDAHGMAMGILAVIFLAALLKAADLIHGTIASSIVLRLGNRELVADLQAKTNELSQINKLLRAEIDQRTGVQDRLQEQLFFHQELMDAIPNPLFHKDTKGVYLGCNKAFEKFVGRARAGIIGRTAFDLFPKELAGSLTRLDRELFERGYLRAVEMDFPAADGATRRVITHRALYHNPLGRVIGVIGVLADVTDRRTVFRRSRPEEDAGRPARSR